MNWGLLPIWLKIWLFAGIGSWFAIYIPYGLSFKTARCPALIFGTSIAALVLWGHLR